MGTLDLTTLIFRRSQDRAVDGAVARWHKNNRIIRPTDDYIGGPMKKKVRRLISGDPILSHLAPSLTLLLTLNLNRTLNPVVRCMTGIG